MGRDEEITRAGEYELRVRVLHRGTRSEGRAGRLFHRGKPVPPGHPIEADGVRFVFLGDERPHLWSVSGWACEPTPPAGSS